MLTFKAHQKPICDLAFSPDGLTLATSARRTVEREEWVTLWNLDDLTRVAQFPGGSCDPPVAFSPEGRFFATGDGSLDVYALEGGLQYSAVRVYDTVTWAETTGYEWKIGKLTSVAVSQDGLRAACGSRLGRVMVWDLE